MSRRACDRCHSIRSRCHWNTDDACDRCLRLDHDCRTERSVLKPGRPRKNEGPKQHQSPEILTDLKDTNLEDLDEEEILLAKYFLQHQRFENGFVGDSSLGLSMQSAPIRLLLSAPGRIKDAMLALAGTMQSTSSPSRADDALLNMDRCCKALERLRQSDVRSLDDASATLFVATSLISFNDMTIGYGFLPIARAALISIKPWHCDLSNASNFDPHLIPVIFAELSECVRSREIPTVQYSNSPKIVDPSYGIAQEVLPYLYDICVLNSLIISGKTQDLTRQAQATLKEIQSWIPQLPTEDEAGCDLSEYQRNRIIHHAGCYKLLAQLLLLQLYPEIGESDQNAHQMADLVFNQIKQVSDQAESGVQYLLFPFFVACTELRDEIQQAHVLADMKRLSGNIATESCNRMFEFLQLVWATRKIDPSVSWFDLVEEGVSFSIGP